MPCRILPYTYIPYQYKYAHTSVYMCMCRILRLIYASTKVCKCVRARACMQKKDTWFSTLLAHALASAAPHCSRSGKRPERMHSTCPTRIRKERERERERRPQQEGHGERQERGARARITVRGRPKKQESERVKGKRNKN